MKYKQLVARVTEIERAILHLAKNEKIKCSECKRERVYPIEFHNSMIGDSVKKKVCKICVNRKSRERKFNKVNELDPT